MTDFTPPHSSAAEHLSLLDEILRDVLPEIKLALGELIDRENVRALPSRYARLLPESVLAVSLRPDAAEAVAPMAAALERELTDSCNRHGSLYDRTYRVQLRRTSDDDAPLFTVSVHAGHEPAGAPEPESAAPHADLPAVAADRAREVPANAPTSPLPLADPDATRLEDAVGPPGWQPGRWVLVVEDDAGEEREAFRLTDPYTTVGRRSDDPQLHTGVALRDVPHVSRRQLALIWEERDGAPGWRVYNVGLNAVHLPGQEIPGAHVGRGALRLDQVAEASTGWLPPGVPMRIGDQGPVLRVDEVPEGEEEKDPDATRFE